MPAAIPAEVKDVAKSMYFAGLEPSTISADLGVAIKTVYKWVNRGKWGVARDTAKGKLISRGKASLAIQAGQDIAASSANTRAHLASVVERQAAALAKQQPTAESLANTRERQGQAAVAKTVMETARGVFEWGETSRPGLVLSVKLGAEVLSKPTSCSVIDLQAEAPIDNPLSLQDGQLNVSNIVRNTLSPLPGEPAGPTPADGPAAAASPGPNAGPDVPAGGA